MLVIFIDFFVYSVYNWYISLEYIFTYIKIQIFLLLFEREDYFDCLGFLFLPAQGS